MQVAAGSEGSPAATQRGDQQSAKKPRMAEPIHIPVKQEMAVHQPAAAVGDAVATVAADGGSRIELAVKMDVAVLHCPICMRPLKPPVYQCKVGHLACGGCLTEPCGRCEDGGGAFDVRSTVMDAVVSSTTAECDHDGCERYVIYHELADHRGACPHAPCRCTVPGCGFVGPAPALLGHLTTLHSMPMHRLQYGKVLPLQVPASLEPRRLLVGEEDDRAFLLVGGAHGSGAAVSVVCIRAEAMVWPRYTFKVWAHGPAPAPNRKADTVMAEIEVTSSTAPGDVAVEELTYLAVPPKMLLVGAGASGWMSLKIRIDKFTSS